MLKGTFNKLQLTINKNRQSKIKGFTLIEILVVVGVILILFSFVSINIFNLPETSTSDATINTMLGDIKTQQIKAMAGDTEGKETPDNYGVYFSNTSYTQFRGSSYNVSDPDNYTSTLPPDYSIQTTLPSSQLVFSKSSGEISGFVSTQNSIILRNNQSGTQKTISFNKYGTIVDIQ